MAGASAFQTADGSAEQMNTNRTLSHTREKNFVSRARGQHRCRPRDVQLQHITRPWRRDNEKDRDCRARCVQEKLSRIFLPVRRVVISCGDTMRIRICCQHCRGSGRLTLSPVLARTLRAVPQNEFIATGTVRQIAVMRSRGNERGTRTAFNNRLDKLAEHGLVEKRDFRGAATWRRIR